MNFELIDIKRESERYTITAFCDLVGIDRTTYYKYMKNSDNIKYATLIKMFDVLRMTKAERQAVMK